MKRKFRTTTPSNTWVAIQTSLRIPCGACSIFWEGKVKFFVLRWRTQTNAGTQLPRVEKASGRMWSDLIAVSTSPSKHLPSVDNESFQTLKVSEFISQSLPGPSQYVNVLLKVKIQSSWVRIHFKQYKSLCKCYWMVWENIYNILICEKGKKF